MSVTTASRYVDVGCRPDRSLAEDLRPQELDAPGDDEDHDGRRDIEVPEPLAGIVRPPLQRSRFPEVREPRPGVSEPGPILGGPRAGLVEGHDEVMAIEQEEEHRRGQEPYREDAVSKTKEESQVPGQSVSPVVDQNPRAHQHQIGHQEIPVRGPLDPAEAPHVVFDGAIHLGAGGHALVAAVAFIRHHVFQEHGGPHEHRALALARHNRADIHAVAAGETCRGAGDVVGHLERVVRCQAIGDDPAPGHGRMHPVQDLVQDLRPGRQEIGGAAGWIPALGSPYFPTALAKPPVGVSMSRAAYNFFSASASSFVRPATSDAHFPSLKLGEPRDQMRRPRVGETADRPAGIHGGLILGNLRRAADRAQPAHDAVEGELRRLGEIASQHRRHILHHLEPLGAGLVAGVAAHAVGQLRIQPQGLERGIGDFLQVVGCLPGREIGDLHQVHVRHGDVLARQGHVEPGTSLHAIGRGAGAAEAAPAPRAPHQAIARVLQGPHDGEPLRHLVPLVHDVDGDQCLVHGCVPLCAKDGACAGKMLKNSLIGRLLKKVQMQGGASRAK